MKKILFFTRTMGLGGTENVILQLCEHFCKDFDITVMSCGGINTEALQKLGIKHIQVGDITNKNPLTLIKTVFFIKRFLKNNHFDIIHTHHRMAAFYISLCKPRNCKLIHTMHNSFSDKKKLTEKALKNFTVVCCGETVKKDILSAYNLDKNNVICIPNTIREKEFTQNKNNKEKPFIFGFFGRFTEQKGTDFLVKTFVKSQTESVLYLYGDGDQKKDLESIVSENHVEDKIIFKGVVSNVIQEMQNVDCVILPSRWEGLPLTIIEAFYAERVVLASDIENNTELVNEENGFLFKKDNEESLLIAIDKVINSNADNKIKIAKELYKSVYSNKCFFDKYSKIYNTK